MNTELTLRPDRRRDRGPDQRPPGADGSRLLKLPRAATGRLEGGHANHGVTVHDRLEEFAAGANRSNIASSTIGIGLSHDENLLAAISRGGSGNAHFAEHGDEGGVALAAEVEGLLDQTVQATSLVVKPSGDVVGSPLQRPPRDPGRGRLHARGREPLCRRAAVPFARDRRRGDRQPRPGQLRPRARWVDVDLMKSELATLPVSVNVVPGDQAAGCPPYLKCEDRHGAEKANAISVPAPQRV